MTDAEIETIVQAYGQVLEVHAGKIGWGTALSLLPYPKDDIKKALQLAYLNTPEHNTRRLDLLCSVYSELACFNADFPDEEPESNQERARRFQAIRTEQTHLENELVALQVRLNDIWRKERETQVAVAKAFAENSGAGTTLPDWRWALAVVGLVLAVAAFR